MGNVLITGGSGFVGLHVCEILATRIDGNGTVLSLDLRPGEAPSLNNKIKMVTGDISNFQELLEIVRRYEVEGIIAVAAMVGGSDTAKAPLRALSVNTLGPANLLECARIADLEKVVYVSSHSVYGKRPDLIPIREEDMTNPDNVYRYTKLMGEQVCAMYRECYGLDAVVLRPSLVYGPRRPRADTLTSLLAHALTKGGVKLSCGALERLDYVYVKDVARGMISAFGAKNHSSSVYNLGSGISLSPVDICKIIKELIPHFEFEIGPGFFEENGGWVQGPLDIERASRDFSHKPTPPREAIADYIEWLENHPDELERLQ